jgi:hypothetical protein
MLFVGANVVARALGVALRDQGFRVKLADTSYEEIRAARMLGLEVYYGDPISSHADQFLELTGIGRLFAVSRRSRWNTLSCMKFRSEFGPQRVFSLRNSEDKDVSERARIADEYAPPRLFGPDVTYQKLASLLARGAEIKTIRLSNDFSLEDYKRENRANVIPLFTLGDKQKLRVIDDPGALPEPDSYQRLMAIIWKNQSPEKPEASAQDK